MFGDDNIISNAGAEIRASRGKTGGNRTVGMTIFAVRDNNSCKASTEGEKEGDL